MARFPNLSRQALAETLCEWFDWRRANGNLKSRECRDFLQQLQAQALIELPPLRSGRLQGSTTKILRSRQGEANESWSVTLSEVQPLSIRRVEQPAEHRLWRELIGRFHYLGCRTPYGASVRYLFETSHHKLLGCLQFSSAAWQMKARDVWIGWDNAARKQHLSRLINNSRFLILP